MKFRHDAVHVLYYRDGLLVQRVRHMYCTVPQSILASYQMEVKGVQDRFLIDLSLPPYLSQISCRVINMGVRQTLGPKSAARLRDFD